MTTIETKYNEYIADFRAALKSGDQDLIQKMDKGMIPTILEWCMEAPRDVLELKEELTNEQLEVGLRTCVPIIRELVDGSYVMILHGDPDGYFIDGFWGELLRPDDNRVALYFPRGATIYVLSCYPASRKQEWKHIERYFKNLAHDAGVVPLAGGVKDGKLYVREVSSVHAELVSDMAAGKF